MHFTIRNIQEARLLGAIWLPILHQHFLLPGKYTLRNYSLNQGNDLISPGKLFLNSKKIYIFFNSRNDLPDAMMFSLVQIITSVLVYVLSDHKVRRM